MQYLLLIYGARPTPAARGPGREAAWFSYSAGSCRSPARWSPATALQGPETATTVRVRDGETLVTDGPFAETKEMLGGYYLDRRARPRRRAGLGGEDAERRATARSRSGRSWSSTGDRG